MHSSHNYLQKKISVTIDRPLGSLHPKWGFRYPLNYGFIEGTIAPDGEELDAYILGVENPIESFEGVCIAIIHRTNDDDDKLIVVPEGMSYSDASIRNLTHFQEQFFESLILREAYSSNESE